ncbi:MAG: hypothetical protein RBT67_09350, partial [Thauera sp.]|nr:hypothetical protein [Thauera sp.]
MRQIDASRERRRCPGSILGVLCAECGRGLGRAGCWSGFRGQNRLWLLGIAVGRERFVRGGVLRGARALILDLVFN